MRRLAENLWLLEYPLSVLGTQHGRNVTVIRLRDGRLVLHSMAPFTEADREGIRERGEPAWLVEAMLLHDTYAAEGRKCFPGVPFLGPEGFEEIVGFPVAPLVPPPSDWAGEVEVALIRGAPRLGEHAFLHLPSRTLIVADLIFNFDAGETGWNRFFHRHVAGFRRYPGTSRIFRWFVSDREALRRSIEELLSWDFDRIVVGHGKVIEREGKELLCRALDDAGLF